MRILSLPKVRWYGISSLTTLVPGLGTVLYHQVGEQVQSHAFLCFPPSNPKVQVEAIEGGALQKLLVILATEQPLPAKKKVGFCSLLPSPQHTHGA